LPESFTYRRMTVIERRDGPALQMAQAKARQHQMYVIAPIVEDRAGRLFNAAYLIDRQGEIVGCYDKLFPTPGELAMGIVPGDELPVFATDFGTIAVITCYDHDWPELFAICRQRGARLIFWPTMAYGYAEFDHLVVKSTICFDNDCFLVASNYYYWSDPAPAQDFRHTYILSPEGVPLADASYRPGLISTQIDLDFHWPARDHQGATPQPWHTLLAPYRRPDLYAPLREGLNDAAGNVEAGARPETRAVRVAALCLPEAHVPDPKLAIERIDSLLAQETHAEIAVLPENCLYGGAAEEETPPQPLTPQHVAELQALARKHNVYLMASGYQPAVTGWCATALLIDGEGKVIGDYAKTHLSHHEACRYGVQAGDELPVFTTPFGKVGLLLGRDIFYPEAFATLACQGADLVLWGGSTYPLYPNAWQMRHLLMARAVSYGASLAAASYSAPPPHLSRKLQRGACIIDQFAQVRADTGAAAGIACARLELPPMYLGPNQSIRARLATRPEILKAAWE
jgi:predicted amidohydrolase